MDPFALPMHARWLLMRVLLDELRPLCVPPPPPLAWKFVRPGEPPVQAPDSSVRPSRVPVQFSTPEKRLEVIHIVAETVWNALRLQSNAVGGSYKHCVESVVPAPDLIIRNLPDQTHKHDLEEYTNAADAYRSQQLQGMACGLTSPLTGNYWFFDEAARVQYVQMSPAAEWAPYLARLCRFYQHDFGESWAPPSTDGLGRKECWGADADAVGW